jgi:hypothetical protein
MRDLLGQSQSVNDTLAFVASGIVAAWGVSHIIPTQKVVAGFGDLSRENSLVITMEWVAEGLALLFVAALVIAATIADQGVGVSYIVCAGFLLVVGAWTAFTGARTGVIWFKMCPVVMVVSATLLVVAALA